MKNGKEVGKRGGVSEVLNRCYRRLSKKDLGRVDRGQTLVILGIGNSLAEYRVEDMLPIYTPRDDAFEEERMAMLEEGNKMAMRCTCHRRGLRPRQLLPRRKHFATWLTCGLQRRQISARARTQTLCEMWGQNAKNFRVIIQN